MISEPVPCPCMPKLYSCSWLTGCLLLHMLVCAAAQYAQYSLHIIFIRNFSTPSNFFVSFPDPSGNETTNFCECSKFCQFLYSLFYHKHQLAQHDSKVTVYRTAVSTYGPVFAPDFAWFHTARDKGYEAAASCCKKYVIITTSNIM